MKGLTIRLGIVATAASVALLLAPAAGQAKVAITKVEIGKATQTSLLKRKAVTVNFRAKLGRTGRPKRTKLTVSSSTFDQDAFKRLASKRVRIVDGAIRSNLRLKGPALAAIAGCESRTLRIRAGADKDTAELVRDSDACKPRALDLSRASDCDFIGQQGGSPCMLPFPDDYYTVADADTATGRRIDFHLGGMPANAGATHIDSAPYNLNDGFSPGETILVKVPGLDTPQALAQTDPAPINQIGRYAEADAPVVVIDATTGQRWPVWSEIDSNASTPAATALEVHPAVNWDAKHRYVVALRDLRDSGGEAIEAPAGFRYYRDGLPSGQGAINQRRKHFESIFRTLRAAGIRRSSLYLAWDFTVASDENIATRMLHIRDDAFGVLGDDDMADRQIDGDAPTFSVTSTQNFTPLENDHVARRVKGTFTVPCYLEPDCQPGGRFQLDSNGLPTRNGDYTANFDCIIGRSAIDGGSPVPGKPAPYGHGLFGGAGEVFGSEVQRELADTHHFVFCATDEIGMSGGDVGNTIANILPDLSNFPELADRLQQGLLDELYLARLMYHPQGLVSDKAFHVDDTDVTLSTPAVIDTDDVYYVGASQGGIMGGALTAVSPDFTRAALNVPAMNYSVLLPRSVDYDQFETFLNPAYPNELGRPLLLDLIQMLWDRGEPNGYAHRMTTDPLPDTPAHKVLMQVALGDHQVSNYQADVEARTIGASTHSPVLDPGRWPGVDVLWNVPRLTDGDYPFNGSAIFYGDIGPIRPNDLGTPPPAMIGVDPPPLTNVPNYAGEDPHGAPRGAPLALKAISSFLSPGGTIPNVCGASPCYAGGYAGP